ncbi:MAG: hypothetical protein P8126_04995, partial [Gammaproteobacteria bacterium]
ADPCPASFITLLPGLSLLQISGGDAAEFLHNQFTCEVRALEDGGGCPGAWCSPKGRVITTFVLYRLGGEFFLLMPTTLLERVVKRLRMFVLRAEVKITDFTAERTVMGMRGGNHSLTEDGSAFRINRLNKRLHLFLPAANGGRFLIVDDDAALQPVWLELAKTVPPADTRCWNRLDMEAGIPWLNEETTEQFLPQELNLDQIGALSFDKGCYPGQEIVARVHYRGQVKRRLYSGHAETGAAASAGMKLRDNAGKTMGTVVTAVPDITEGVMVLAVIDTASVDAGNIQLEDGSMLHIDPGIAIQ